MYIFAAKCPSRKSSAARTNHQKSITNSCQWIKKKHQNKQKKKKKQLLAHKYLGLIQPKLGCISGSLVSSLHDPTPDFCHLYKSHFSYGNTADT